MPPPPPPASTATLPPPRRGPRRPYRRCARTAGRQGRGVALPPIEKCGTPTHAMLTGKAAPAPAAEPAARAVARGGSHRPPHPTHLPPTQPPSGAPPPLHVGCRPPRSPPPAATAPLATATMATAAAAEAQMPPATAAAAPSPPPLSPLMSAAAPLPSQTPGRSGHQPTPCPSVAAAGGGCQAMFRGKKGTSPPTGGGAPEPRAPASESQMAG